MFGVSAIRVLRFDFVRDKREQPPHAVIFFRIGEHIQMHGDELAALGNHHIKGLRDAIFYHDRFKHHDRFIVIQEGVFQFQNPRPFLQRERFERLKIRFDGGRAANQYMRHDSSFVR